MTTGTPYHRDTDAAVQASPPPPPPLLRYAEAAVQASPLPKRIADIGTRRRLSESHPYATLLKLPCKVHPHSRNHSRIGAATTATCTHIRWSSCTRVRIDATATTDRKGKPPPAPRPAKRQPPPPQQSPPATGAVVLHAAATHRKRGDIRPWLEEDDKGILYAALRSRLIILDVTLKCSSVCIVPNGTGMIQV